MEKRVAAANTVLLLVFVVFVLFYFDPIRERLLPPMYDDAASFARIDPRPGWTDTGIVIEEGRPIGIVAAGKVSTPRVRHDTASGSDQIYDIGPEGAQVPERRIPDWRELDDFPAFALVGRVNGGPAFAVGPGREVATPGRLELKINCPMWDKTIPLEPGTTRPRRRRSPLTAQELDHLRAIRGFFAYRTWDLRQERPRAPRLPLTAAEISERYGLSGGQ